MPVRPAVDLAALFRRAAAGTFPTPDGSVVVVPQPPGRVAAVLAFTGHHVIAADVDPAWVHAHLAVGDLAAPVAAPFLDALAGELGRDYDNLDLVLAADGAAGPPGGPLAEVEPDPSHPRVARSLRYRSDVRTFTPVGAAGQAVLILARGLAGRWEAAFEVEAAARGRGLGRALAAAAPHLVGPGEAVFLQVAPGNVASLRAVLATGRYRPIGAELQYPDPVR